MRSLGPQRYHPEMAGVVATPFGERAGVSDTRSCFVRARGAPSERTICVLKWEREEGYYVEVGDFVFQIVHTIAVEECARIFSYVSSVQAS